MLIVLFALFSVGSATIHCSYNGKNYQNGDTWIEQKAFAMRCTILENYWKVEITNCLTPEGIQVNVNNSAVSGNWEYHCETRTNGMVGLRQTVAKNANCKGVNRFGSIWVERSFKFRCAEYGVPALVGCITKHGDTIKAGSTKVIDLMEYECRQYSNGTVTFHGKTAPKSAVSVCFDPNANVIRQNNEVYFVGNYDMYKFQTKCVNGEPTIIGCMNNRNEVIPVESIKEVGRTRYSCATEKDGVVRYRAEQIADINYLLKNVRA